MHPTEQAKLNLILDALQERASATSDVPVHVTGFVAWMLNGSANDGSVIATLASTAAASEGASRSFREVAALGFTTAVAEIGAQAFQGGIAWLMGREYFVANRPRGLEADGIAAFGITLGILSLEFSERAKFVKWLDSFLSEALKEITPETWDSSLMQASAELLRFSTQGVSTSTASLPPDLLAALDAKALLASTPEQQSKAFELITSLSYRDFGPDRAATQLTALRWLLRASPTALPGKATVSDVVTVLEAIPRALRLWTWEEKSRTGKGPAVMWPINHEYHVQNLLWVILAPLFPDLEDEENLPSLGQKKPRADIGIPSLKLIVEAKFIYKGNKKEFAEMIDQIGSDASTYLTQPEKYNSIIAFVWDNSRRMEEHAELKQGLEKIPNVVGAVIVARPGKMNAAAV